MSKELKMPSQMKKIIENLKDSDVPTENLPSVMKAMEWAYAKATNGVEEMAEKYLQENDHDFLKATDSLIRWQNNKAAVSGFLSSFGGAITLPVTIPADMASMLYIQLRMIAAIAYLGGYNVENDKVRTLAFACLAGKGATDIIRNAGVQITQNLARNFLERQIKRTVLQKIQRMIGLKVAESAGKIVAVQLIKCVPLLGGLAGGGVNFLINKKVALVAQNIFIGKYGENRQKTVFDDLSGAF